MKKEIALLLTLLLSAGISVPAYAAEDTAQDSGQKQAVVVSLDSIEDIMTTYNLDLQTYKNSLKAAKDNKEEQEDDGGDEEYLDDQYDIALSQYSENVSNAVLSAQNSYLAYCADYDQYSSAQTAAVNAEKAYNVALSSLSAGFVAQNECDGLKDTYLQTQNTLVQLDRQIDRDRTALRTLLNLPDDVNMTVKPVANDSLDLSGIPNINYDADLIVMMGLNSKIRQANLNYDALDRKYGYSSTGMSEHDVENAKIAAEQTKESEKAAFKKLYDSLNSAYTVYQQDLDKVQRAQQALDTEKKAFAAGYSSQQSVNAKTSDLNTLQSTLATDRNTLYTSYLSYTNMKKGFSTGS